VLCRFTASWGIGCLSRFFYSTSQEENMKRIIIVVAALLIVLGGFYLKVSTPVSVAQAQSDFPAASGEIQASQGTVGAGVQVHLDLLNAPPTLSPEQQKAMETALEKGPRVSPPLPEGKTAVQRIDSVVDPASATAAPPASSLNTAGTFTLFRNTDIVDLKPNASRITEPTVINSGSVVFMTGNWFAGISSDGGKTFKYVDPYTMFPASAGGFCCDQVAVYDPARDIILWYLQYISSGSPGSGTNLFRVAVARPQDAVNGSWYYYDFTSAANTEWDYPDVALSNDYLWITTNRGPFNGSYVDDAWIFKMPLDPMMTASGFGYSNVDLGAAGVGNLSLRMTRGAHEVMYFGAHNTTSQIRIFSWAENSGSVGINDVNLSTPWYNSTHVCPGPDGRDWCGFDDGRIKAGWVSRGTIGFMWGSGQGGGFAYPYIEAVRVKESDRTYIDRPFVWNSSGAYAYPSAAPNARGDLGVAGFWGGGGVSGWYPYFWVVIDDDFSRDAGYTPAPWELYYVRQSTNGPSVNRWGDYISVQPFNPTSLAWAAAGFTLQGCPTSYCSEPSYTIFGRERDLRSVALYMDPRFATFMPMLKMP
jgi:hypothetical protein